MTRDARQNTADPAAQDRERAIDRRLEAIELADLEDLLRTVPGRRFYYRLVFELGNLESLSLDLAVKDGICAAIHMARIEGMRAVASTLRDEAIQHFPELWTLMLQERVAAAAEEQRKRREARSRSSTTTEGDT